ncbi:MAG: hypothetical protein ACE37H_05230 [Phycisphaeraceae bacterium]
MKRCLPALLCAALSAAVSPACLAQDADAPKPAAPQPDAVTNSWSFDFQHSTPDTIAIENADGSVDWYWYMTYKVTNYEQDELFFDPRIVIQNDAGEIITANLGVDPRVFRAVLELTQNPLLVPPVEVPGRVFKGEDYARESVAIWPVDKDDVDQFKVFVGGIFGEVKLVTDPSTGKPITVPVIDALTGEPKTNPDGSPMTQPLLLKRTKMLHYKTPGTTESKQNPAIKLEDEKDVMR